MSTEFLTNQNIKLNLIVAMCNSNLGIGINGEIPWRLPTDMKHFASVTTFTEDKKKINAVIMGRLTWLSIPKKFRPMPNRLNVIISSIFQNVSELETKKNGDLSRILVCKSFDEAVELITNDYKDTVENMYAIGGSQIYKKCLEYQVGFLDKLYLTRVYTDVQCDVFLQPNNFLDSFDKIEYVEISNLEFNKLQKDEKTGVEYCFEAYQKVK